MNMIGKMRSLVVAVLIPMMILSSGCTSIKAPETKLDRSIYSPEGTIDAGGRYAINVRDELEISVWRCPELSSTVVVRPQDGGITLPLVGDVKAAGKTPRELAQAISKKMAYYVKEPRVAVGIKEFGDKKVYIMGDVVMQGSYYLESGDRLIDLLTRSGGFTEDSSPAATYVIRGTYDDPQIIRANVERLLLRADISQNIYLMEGDIIVVPSNTISKVNETFRLLFPAMYFGERLTTLKTNIMSGGFDWSNVWNKVRLGDKPFNN
ncbi:MAG: polysaccharide biosynthesis/export family protein [Candidatus Tantalella remota]|nr:polysaccharide biosynthesis/export family protein [Candidatus Tantalella remota]